MASTAMDTSEINEKIMEMNNLDITIQLLDYGAQSIEFSTFTYPWLEQINEDGLHNKPIGGYYEYLKWLTFSLINNDKIIKGKKIRFYIKEIKGILMRLEEDSITGIIPVPDGFFKQTLQKNSDNGKYFKCSQGTCISNSHLMEYLNDDTLPEEAPPSKRRRLNPPTPPKGGKKTRNPKRKTRKPKRKTRKPKRKTRKSKTKSCKNI
jgi:hypothetical protein